MRYIIIGKKQIVCVLIFAFCAISLLFAFSPSSNISQTASGAKKIPIYSVGREDKLISLTFDAAWGDSDTQELIEIFDKYDVKVTIFVVGDWVDRCAQSVKAFHDAGHEIMNHSDTHAHMSQISKTEIIKEINDCNDKIEKITGIRPSLHRAPYGEYNNTLIETLDEMNIKCIQWDVDSLDYKNYSVAEIQERVLSKVRPGSIVLFHNDAENTTASMPGIIEKLLADGYKIVPVSENIYTDNYVLDFEGRQQLIVTSKN